MIFNLLNYSAGVNEGNYKPKAGRYFFEDELTYPVRIRLKDLDCLDGEKEPKRPRHTPVYGELAKRFAIQKEHFIADPPGKYTTVNQTAKYNNALDDVIRIGGSAYLPSTKRSPA